MPTAVHRRFPTVPKDAAERGQVSVGMALTAVAVLAAVLGVMVFAQAVDMKAGARKGADAAALAAAKEARGNWLELWLRGQGIAPETVPQPDTAVPQDAPSPTPTPTEDEDELPVDFNYVAPEPFWAAAAPTGLSAASSYASRNDGSSVTGYSVQGGNRIVVDVETPRREAGTKQGKKLVDSLQAPASATSQVKVPAGLTCAPVPGGTWKKWTLRCTSARGSATAEYSGTVLLTWDRKAFEHMFLIRLTD